MAKAKVPGPETDPVEWMESVGASSRMVEGARGFQTLREAWESCRNPNWMFWFLFLADYRDDRTCQRIACRVVREIWPLLIDERSRRVVEVAERFVAGEADRKELATARKAAKSVYHNAGFWVLQAAAWAAADAASEAGCWGASSIAAGAADWKGEARMCDIIREEIDPWEDSP